MPDHRLSSLFHERQCLTRKTYPLVLLTIGGGCELATAADRSHQSPTRLEE